MESQERPGRNWYLQIQCFTLDGNFSAMMSWISFEERMGEYSEIAQIRKRDKEAVEIEIFKAENRIRELKIEHERLN